MSEASMFYDKVITKTSKMKAAQVWIISKDQDIDPEKKDILSEITISF